MRQHRILVTGARDWRSPEVIERAIHRYLRARVSYASAVPPGSVTVLHGGAQWADALAETIAHAQGFRVERYPADWAAHGGRAGPMRNQAMVAAGADVCLAFPMARSAGTWDCIRRAHAAGIEVRIFFEEHV